mmetsp:Transcript_39457/g.104128  ORF Transcript_39457/g.104128 Transcript_39457/m.104128 type:complete len:200 (+) Transcript_39457:488-1087(+)
MSNVHLSRSRVHSLMVQAPKHAPMPQDTQPQSSRPVMTRSQPSKQTSRHSSVARGGCFTSERLTAIARFSAGKRAAPGTSSVEGATSFAFAKPSSTLVEGARAACDGGGGAADGTDGDMRSAPLPKPTHAAANTPRAPTATALESGAASPPLATTMRRAVEGMRLGLGGPRTTASRTTSSAAVSTCSATPACRGASLSK